ncbi:alpha/beta fold hydrolase [Paraliomyxa miuraensis]|uniref:alpha/beta fold hydrolase n=1 Tax=Paraliomyxa miuraensis TaxID=376150 RepID=UPI0022541C9D|nr:alpha/beta hydrolase [Paraliomyxa miuraensis]MCX4245460.1 alpha/beta hydrolase [Paraliomyxa miuraensis]
MTAPRRPADRSRLLATSAGRVYAVDRGPLEGPVPPLVLLHGLLVTHHAFRAILEPLATGTPQHPGRRVIALDLPGGGESDRPEPSEADGYSLSWLAERVDEALGALGVGHCDLLGHSFGGAVALQLASTVPARVRRLVLVDPVAFTMELPLEGKMALVPRLGPLLFTQLYRRADLRRYLVRAFSTPELLDERAVDVYWDRLGRDGGREAGYAMLLQMTRMDALRERLPKVNAPALVVWGDRDGLVPVENGERLVELLPHAELAVVEGCGHAVAEERPDALLELVRGHLGPG